MYTISGVCQAVAAAVSGIDGLPTYAVVLRHLHEWDAKKLRKTLVAVSPRGVDLDNVGRNVVGIDCRVSITIARQCLTEADAEEMFLIVEAVLDAIRSDDIGYGDGTEGRVVLSSATADFGTEEALNEHNVYRASVEATYRILK